MFQINDRVIVISTHANPTLPTEVLNQTGRVVKVDTYGHMPIVVELDKGIKGYAVVNFAESELAPACVGWDPSLIEGDGRIHFTPAEPLDLTEDWKAYMELCHM